MSSNVDTLIRVLSTVGCAVLMRSATKKNKGSPFYYVGLGGAAVTGWIVSDIIIRTGE